MPHPSPVQIAYGSATVVSITFVSLLLAPTGSALAVALTAAVALLAGAGVGAVALKGRSLRGRAPVAVRGQSAPAHQLSQAPQAPQASSLNAPERPGVRV